MAYGSPNSLDQVSDYLAQVRGGRDSSQEEIERLKHRYQRVGGQTPLLQITKSQAEALKQQWLFSQPTASLSEPSPPTIRTRLNCSKRASWSRKRPMSLIGILPFRVPAGQPAHGWAQASRRKSLTSQRKGSNKSWHAQWGSFQIIWRFCTTWM